MAPMRQCRHSLVAAMDRAADEVPDHLTSSLITVPQDDMYLTTGQNKRNEDFICFRLSAILQDLCEYLDMQTLEDLVAKLEFENELNRVCSGSVQIQNPESSSEAGENRGCEYSDVEEASTNRWAHGNKEDCSFLIDTILEIEQDYDVTANCDVSFMEHVLQLSS